MRVVGRDCIRNRKGSSGNVNGVVSVVWCRIWLGSRLSHGYWELACVSSYRNLIEWRMMRVVLSRRSRCYSVVRKEGRKAGSAKKTGKDKRGRERKKARENDGAHAKERRGRETNDRTRKRKRKRREQR